MYILATLIAVAAWCGQPNPYYTSQDVDQCRQQLLHCLDKTPHDPKCFTEQILKENIHAEKDYCSN